MYKKGTGNDKQRKTQEIERFAHIEILGNSIFLLTGLCIHTGEYKA